MSVYEDAFDAPLLAAPWVPLPTSPKPLVLKYAQHPSRPGYIVLLTDLTSVYVEVLTAPSVPSRLNEAGRHFKATAKGKGKGKAEVDDDEDDIIQRTERALKDVGKLWDGDTQGREVEMQPHDYHDAVLSVHTDDFAWLFYLTELKGRQPLEVLSKQLIAPLASSLLEQDSIKIKPKSSPIDILHTLFSKSISSAAPARSSSNTTARPSAKGVKRSQSPQPPRAAESEGREEDEEEEEGQYASDEETLAPADFTRSRDTPTKSREGRRAQSDPASETEAASSEHPSAPAEPNDIEAEDEAPAPRPHRSPAAKSRTRHVIQSDDDDEDERADSVAPLPKQGKSVKSKPDKPKTSAKEDGDKDEGKDRSLSPPRPTPSQTRKERERAEEEEMQERAEVMKRKMEHGGAGGGNLGRRRLRR